MKVRIAAEFDHPEGHVKIGLSRSNTVYIKVDDTIYTHRHIPRKYDSDIIFEILKFESRFWKEQGRPLNEIEYNIENLEYKIRQWPYIRPEP